MTRPNVPAITEEAYQALGPWTLPDPAHDYFLLRFVASVTNPLQAVEDLARDTDDAPGWAVLFRPDKVPVEYLDWLGQFLGVEPILGLSVAARRARLSETAGFRRGTVAAIEGAARQFLTGSRQVKVFERDGSPYRIRVRTYLAETPNPIEVRRALLDQKPAGIVMTYDIASGSSYQELTDEFPTYQILDGIFDKYDDMTLWISGVGAEYRGGTFKVRI